MPFYHYSQNNSGGSFCVDERVAHHVIIEADSPGQANMIAEGVGIYFNGCADGRDCDCCGDRWYEMWDSEKGNDEPLIYGDDPKIYKDLFTAHNEPYCHIYYLDGLKKTFRTHKPPQLKLPKSTKRIKG